MDFVLGFYGNSIDAPWFYVVKISQAYTAMFHMFVLEFHANSIDISCIIYVVMIHVK